MADNARPEQVTVQPQGPERLDRSRADPWAALRALTPARLALGRTGTSLPTGAHLDFQLAHARARDAVHLAFDAPQVRADLEALGLEVLELRSAAPDRATYLRRPDLGRRLDEAGREAVRAWAEAHPGEPDLALVVADGLSAEAVHTHAAALVAALLPGLRERGWTVAPVILAHQGRVALGDEVGEGLRARQVAVLIGERPGLSVPASLGVYLTHAPRPGRTDAERNCISNIHAGGLSPGEAARTLLRLLDGARALGGSGVALKDGPERGLTGG